MRKTFFALLISVISLILNEEISAQGCVAIRSTGAICSLHMPDSISMQSKWQLGVNYRYFKSYKHFVGKEEQKARVDTGSNVINHSNTIDIALTHQLNNRCSLLIDVPILAYSRSSLHDH